MISDSSPFGPRSTARTHDRLTRKRRWTRRNSPPASSSSSLSMPRTAACRRPSSVTSQTSLPSASAKRTSGRRSRTMRSPLMPTMRAAGVSAGLGPLVLDRIAVFGSEDRERPDRLVAEKDRAQGDPAGLAAELGHDLRRADPAAVVTRLRGRVTGEAREVQARLPAHRGVECRHSRGDAEQEAGLLVGDDDLAARVQGGERLSGPRSRLGEGRGQFGAAVLGALAQDRARAAHRLGQPSGGLGRKLGAPGRDVEDRDGVVGHGVANGHAGTDPLVEARAPVLGPADQHRPGRLERGAHPVRPRRPFRPARPWRHVAVARAASVSLSPWTVRIRPEPSATVTTPPRLSTSLAIDVAAPPSWANTISCSSVCSADDSSCADAGGATSDPGRRGTARDSDTRTWPPRVGPPARGRPLRGTARARRSPLGTAPRHSCDDASWSRSSLVSPPSGVPVTCHDHIVMRFFCRKMDGRVNAG